MSCRNPRVSIRFPSWTRRDTLRRLEYSALERDREPAVCRQVGGKRNRGRADIGLGFDQIVESLYLDVPMREGAPAGVIAGRCVLPET